MKRTAILLLLLLACDARPGRRRDSVRARHDDTVRIPSDTALSQDYVQRMLEGQLGQVPRLGWFLPPARFIASSRHDSVYALSAARDVAAMPLTAQLDSTERTAISRTYGVACDAPDTLYEYSGHAVTGPVRVLYGGRAFGGRVTAGARFAILPDSAIARSRALLTAGMTGAAFFRDTAISVTPELPIYSFHLAYDSARVLRRAGMFLHERDGRLLGREIVSVDGPPCADCEVPTYDDGVGAWFRIVNAFELPGFRFPVLLLDTSTIEGRALSLVSFSPVGVVSRFRQYEYVVNCSTAR